MPLVSIVIPTCDRPDYLLKVISLIESNLNDYELIIADNSKTDSLKNKLADYIKKTNIHYSYIPGQLSVVDNFERTLDMIHGDYVCYLGDDDGIGPEFESIVEWARNKNVDAVYSYDHNGFISNYFWPGVQSKYLGSAYDAKLFVNQFDGRVIPVDPNQSINNAMSNPGAGLQDLPRIYHGIVNTSTLRKVRAKFGHVFGGVSPDIYSGMLLATECTSVYRIDFPFIIPGACVVSTAGQGAEKSDVGDLNKVDHITRFGQELKWPQVIPKFYSPSNVWALSLFAACETIGIPTEKIKFERLYALSFVRYFSYKHEVFKAFKVWCGTRSLIKNIVDSLLSIVYECKFQVYRVFRKIGKIAYSEKSYRCEDILQAYSSLNKHIEKNAIRLVLKNKD